MSIFSCPGNSESLAAICFLPNRRPTPSSMIACMTRRCGPQRSYAARRLLKAVHFLQPTTGCFARFSQTLAKHAQPLIRLHVSPGAGRRRHEDTPHTESVPEIGTGRENCESLVRLSSTFTMPPEKLTTHSLLKALSPDQVEALSVIATQVRFGPGESIFRQREFADGFYLIEKGEVSLEIRTPR